MQTGNFGVEFGRAGGGVFNVVTKSGTNDLHGTLLWRYQSQRFDSVSNLDRLTGRSPVGLQQQYLRIHRGRSGAKEQDFFLCRLPAERSPFHRQQPDADSHGGCRHRACARCFPTIRGSICISARLAICAARERHSTVALGVDPRTGRRPGIGAIRDGRVCAARRPTTARNGWLEWIIINRKRIACPGAIPMTRRSTLP